MMGISIPPDYMINVLGWVVKEKNVFLVAAKIGNNFNSVDFFSQNIFSLFFARSVAAQAKECRGKQCGEKSVYSQPQRCPGAIAVSPGVNRRRGAESVRGCAH